MDVITLPDGKIIYFLNNLYYKNQVIGKTTINTYTVSLSNIEVQGTFYTKTTILPIQNIKNRFIEYWNVITSDTTSNTHGFNIKYDEYFNNSYCSIGNIKPNEQSGAYVMFYNEYAYNSDNQQTIKIGTNICANNNLYDVVHFNIVYSCLYFA